MLLDGKNAVIYGAGGAIGGAIARELARQGAKVFLTGRTLASVESVAKDIVDSGGSAEAAQVDALAQQSIAEHLDHLVDATGRVDISVNAIGIDHLQGIPLVDLPLADYALPITTYATTHFLTATAAARVMATHRSGMILTISTPAAVAGNGVAGGFGVACAAVEGLSRQLAAELGAHGIRVVCLRPDGIPEAARNGSHSASVFGRRAAQHGMTLDEFLDGFPTTTLLQRSPTLQEVANVAAFMASDAARAVTGTVVEVTSGSILG